MRNRPAPGLLIVAMLVVGGASDAHADYRTCERAISLAAAKFVRLEHKALRKCYDAVVTGARPGPCPDFATAGRLGSAAVKLSKKIDASCGGPDGQCGGGDDEPLASIGWDIGSCPDLAGAACGQPIVDCEDVTVCLACIGAAAVAQEVDVTYGDFDRPAGSATVLGCQRTIGKASEKFAGLAMKAMSKCESRILLGYGNGPCPDAIAAAAITKAETKAYDAMCQFCGGADQRCGTGDDLTPASIGFASSCPDVTVPGGVSCAAPITDLQSIVECVGCVARFDVDCAAAAAVPAIVGYPAVCGGAASATPTPGTTGAASSTPIAATATPTLTTTPAAATPTPTPTLPLPTITLPLPSITVPLPSLTLPLPTITLPLPSLTLPLATPTIPIPLETPTLSLPLPSLTLPLPTLPLPSLTLPLPTLPLPSLTLPLPTITLPLLLPTPTSTPTPVPTLTSTPGGATSVPTVTRTKTPTPTPTSTPVCGNGVIEPGEQCELLAGGCSGLQVCLLCQCL